MKTLLLSFVVVFGSHLVVHGADPAAGNFKGVAGLQLYSLRDQFKKDVPGTLDLVKKFGFKEVETAGNYGLGADKLRALLDERGLTAVSAHFQYDALTKDLAAAIKEAQVLGAKYAVCPWIPHEGDSFNEADAKRASADFNRWGEGFKSAGIRFAYHPHGYEFRPAAAGSTETLFDVMVRETKPEQVTFQMDVFWVTHGGQDPAQLLAKYPKRWELMHLKDIRQGAPTGLFTGKSPLTDDVALGTGQVNWAAVLREAARVGVRHYFIEDESPTVVDQIPVSLRYLEAMK